jgi:hypothetical protein
MFSKVERFGSVLRSAKVHHRKPKIKISITKKAKQCFPKLVSKQSLRCYSQKANPVIQESRKIGLDVPDNANQIIFEKKLDKIILAVPIDVKQPISKSEINNIYDELDNFKEFDDQLQKFGYTITKFEKELLSADIQSTKKLPQKKDKVHPLFSREGIQQRLLVAIVMSLIACAVVTVGVALLWLWVVNPIVAIPTTIFTIAFLCACADDF